MTFVSEPTDNHSTTDPAGAETGRLFTAHHKPVIRYLLSFGLVPQDCDEVIQETFASLLLHIRAGKPRQNLPGWIFRVAHNLGLKLRIRNQKGNAARVSAEVAELQADSRPNIEDVLIGEVRAKRVRAVVAALSEQERQCLFLRAEGLRYREIADALGLSLGSVSTALARSLDKLRRSQDPHGS